MVGTTGVAARRHRIARDDVTRGRGKGDGVGIGVGRGET